MNILNNCFYVNIQINIDTNFDIIQNILKKNFTLLFRANA